MSRRWAGAVACAVVGGAAVVGGSALGAVATVDPLARAEARFRALSSYRVLVRSVNADGAVQAMRYAYRWPGWVRMDTLEPRRGAVLVFDPNARTVRVWPFGIERFLSVTLSPDNALIRGPNGHRIDRSDVGALLSNLAALRAKGAISGADEVELSGVRALAFEVSGRDGASVDGVQRYRVWLARDTDFPLRVQSYAAGGREIETVDLMDAELDAELPDTVFAH